MTKWFYLRLKFRAADTFYVANFSVVKFIGRFEDIGLGFLKISLILFNSDGKIREKVV